MSEFDQPLFRAQGKTGPQYFNDDTNSYEVIKGSHGANSFIQLGTVAMEAWEESVSSTKVFGSNRFGFSAINDGAADMTFTINGNTRKLKPSEAYGALFEPFTSVTIVATSTYRAEVLK
jgi:hypothetical protein